MDEFDGAELVDRQFHIDPDFVEEEGPLWDPLRPDQDAADIETRELLEFFGRERRGVVVNKLITDFITELNYEMFPSIEEADYYGTVHIRRFDPLRQDGESISLDHEERESAAQAASDLPSGSYLSSLKLDAEELDFLTYDMSVAKAIETMKSCDRNKMPLFFDPSDRSSLIGTVTLRHIAFESFNNRTTRLVELAQTRVPVARTDEKLSDWIPAILQHGFIYGCDRSGNIVQIYTVHDLALHLSTLSQMFLRPICKALPRPTPRKPSSCPSRSPHLIRAVTRDT